MSKTIESYDQYAKDLAHKFNAIGPRTNDVKRAFSFVKKKDPRILELGCANGRDAKEILKLTKNYTGVDGSEELIKIAKKNLPNVRFIVFDFKKLDFPEKSFDIIFDFASLFHLNKIQLKKILMRVSKWLDINGIILISAKRGRYCRESSKGGFGKRVQYLYEPSDIINMTREYFKVLDLDEQSLRGQDWFTIILQKK